MTVDLSMGGVVLAVGGLAAGLLRWLAARQIEMLEKKIERLEDDARREREAWRQTVATLSERVTRLEAQKE